MTTNLRPKNGVGGWIVLAGICLGGSTGGSYLRPQPPHNPEITTAGWNKMTLDIELMKRDIAKLTVDVRVIAQHLPQDPP